MRLASFPKIASVCLNLCAPKAIEAELTVAGAVGGPHVRVEPPAYRGTSPYQRLNNESRRPLVAITRLWRQLQEARGAATAASSA